MTKELMWFHIRSSVEKAQWLSAFFLPRQQSNSGLWSNVYSCSWPRRVSKSKHLPKPQVKHLLRCIRSVYSWNGNSSQGLFTVSLRDQHPLSWIWRCAGFLQALSFMKMEKICKSGRKWAERAQDWGIMVVSRRWSLAGDLWCKLDMLEPVNLF